MEDRITNNRDVDWRPKEEHPEQGSGDVIDDEQDDGEEDSPRGWGIVREVVVDESASESSRLGPPLKNRTSHDNQSFCSFLTPSFRYINKYLKRTTYSTLTVVLSHYPGTGIHSSSTLARCWPIFPSPTLILLPPETETPLSTLTN
jgi:hypothetical protein